MHKAPGPEIPNGDAAAALLAAGIGCFALGLAIILSEAVPPLRGVLTFSQSVGPLSGKSTVAVALWILSWVAWHRAWRNRTVSFPPVFATALLLIALGLLLSFPPFYARFGSP